jgi:PAS domain S-box-containing protein
MLMDAPGPSTLFDLLPIGAYRSSLDGRQVRANAALVQLNGYASEREMLGAVNDIALERYVDPGRRLEFTRRMQRDGHITDFVSEVFRHRTRERIWIRENAHLVHSAEGRPLYYEGTVEDITGQRQVELALQASERRFRAFTEKSQVLTVMCDEQGRMRYVSPASQRLLGFAPEALMHDSVFDWLHPQDAAQARAELMAVLDFSNSGNESVSRVRHADGGWRHLAMLANNCLGDPAVGGIVLNLRDVSERARAEQALRKLNGELEQRVQRRTRELEHARDEAESASRAKSEFLSRMSHELRTPLNAIVGFGQLLHGDASVALTPAQRGHLGEILRAGDQLLALIDQLLDLSRIEAGQLPLNLQPTALDALMRECLAAMQPLARQCGLALVLGQAGPADGLVLADRLRLKQVLLNLLASALQHNQRSTELRLSVEPDGDALRIVVGDNGIALDALARERLFHAFERLGNDGQSALDAGVGLALSQRLVELMHGHIGLDVQPGGGNRFWVRLARAGAAPADVAAHNGTVLYIEDNAVNVLLMEALLQQQTRLRVLSAPLPELGLQMALAQRPDLILLDIQLPGIDGYEVLRRLRAVQATRDIPVIALSANAMHADVARGRAAGFDDYLTKPIDQQLLLAALSRSLRRTVLHG